MNKQKKVKIFFNYVWVIGVICLSFPSVCAALPADSPEVETLEQEGGGVLQEIYPIRKPDEHFLQQFRDDPAFNYSSYSRENSFWDRLVWWLRKHFFPHTNVSGGRWLYHLLSALAIGAIVFLICKLVRSKYRSPFVRKVHDFKEENFPEIGQMDEVSFPQWVAKAVADGNYALAIRIHYRYVLWLLDGKGIIHRDKYRPNLSYCDEIKEENLQQRFRRLVQIFDCVCYGEFQVGPALYKEVEKEFKDFQQEVSV